jgi:hypothetical protein
MLENEEEHIEHRESLVDFIGDTDDNVEYETDDEELIDDYDYHFDNSMNDIDFSNVSGRGYKRSFGKIKKNFGTKVSGVTVPDNREVIIEGQKRPIRKRKKIVQTRTAPKQRPTPVVQKRVVERESIEKPIIRKRRKNRPQSKRKNIDLNVDVPVSKGKYNLKGKRGKKISDVIVPTDRKVIVKGASDFIVSQQNDQIKNIGYYKGEKLKELILTFNNNSAVDFEVQVFNPSMPLDYMFSTGQNINDKVTVGGGVVSYTDVLFNMLANPTLIPNATFVFAGPNIVAQRSQALKVLNQNIAGEQKIVPLNLDINIDTMQVASDIVYFDMGETLNRPFIPDGMDIITYKVLAGNTVTMAFYYKQVSLKKVFFKNANRKGIL